MISAKVFALLILIGMLLGGVTVFLGIGLAKPYCPTEDSCDPSYGRHWYGKGWDAQEVTP